MNQPSAVKLLTLHLVSLAAVMSRRYSFRVELGGLLPGARSLEFESGFVVQFSDVSPEIREPALPSAEAPDQQTEHVEGPAHRRDLALLNEASLTKIHGLELSQRERTHRQARHIRHDTLEPHSFRCRLQKQRAGNPCGTRRALSHLLAADFCFHLPTWLFVP